MYKAMQNRLIVLLTLLLFFSPLAFGQQGAIQYLKEFKKLNQELPRERIYLHTDRDWYYVGDRIWFSAFIVSGSYTLPSDLSKVLYVELYDPDGEMIERVNIDIENGRGSGSLSFSNSKAQSGEFRIKAYTAWSLNFGDSYTFRKDISVFSIDNESQKTNEPLSEVLDIQFFPESGYLVNGITSRVGFKAIGEDGMGKDVSGKIFTEAGQVVTEFYSVHKGMGDLEFTPKTGEIYYVLVNDIQFDFPKAKEEGVVLTVTNLDDYFNLELEVLGDQFQGPFLYFVHVRGEIYAANTITTNNGKGIATVAKNQLPSGVTHLTILNSEGIPIAERLSFNKNKVDQLNLNLEISEQTVDKRERVDLNMMLSDQEGYFESANVSISVFDDEIGQYSSAKGNIISRLFLETELKGYIEDPGFYFSDHENAQKYLDLLMITQGWRAYKMEEVLNRDDIELFSLPEKGFRIMGTIKSGLLMRGQKEAPIFFSVGGDNEDFQVLTTDDDGKFVIDGIQAEGSVVVNLKANTNKGKDNISILVDDQFEYLPNQEEAIPQSKTTLSNAELPTKINESVVSSQDRAKAAAVDAEQFIEAQMQLELEEITVTSERIEEGSLGLMADFATQIAQDATGRSNTVDFNENENLSAMSMEMILNQLPGVNIIANEISLNTGSSSFSGIPEPLILINGFQTDFTELRNLDPLDVRSISVLRGATDLAIFGANGAGGAIVVSLRKGSSFSNAKGFISKRIEGYQLPMDFYSPKYGVTVPPDLEKKDNRITLHWEPEFELSEANNKLLFWSNDVPSTYRIVVEGISESGTPFYSTTTFDVRN